MVVNLLFFSDMKVGVEDLCTYPTLETYKALKVFIRWNKHQHFKWIKWTYGHVALLLAHVLHP